MNYIINDIAWWKISILGFVNGWLPGFLTFLMGVALSKISNRWKLKQNLKNSLLEIFIPTFNTGSEITLKAIEQTMRDIRITLNAYNQIYPKIFKKQPMKQLITILSQGLLNQDGAVAEEFQNPQKIIQIIKSL